MAKIVLFWSQWPWPLTFHHQNRISSPLGPIGLLYQIWRNSLKATNPNTSKHTPLHLTHFILLTSSSTTKVVSCCVSLRVYVNVWVCLFLSVQTKCICRLFICMTLKIFHFPQVRFISLWKKRAHLRTQSWISWIRLFNKRHEDKLIRGRSTLQECCFWMIIRSAVFFRICLSGRGTAWADGLLLCVDV